MPGSVEHRAVSPLINAFRTWLRGRDHTNALRFADIVAARTQPPPEVPGGPYHKTSKIYYYTRDGRREVTPPAVLSGARQISSGSEVSVQAKPATPGKVWHWD